MPVISPFVLLLFFLPYWKKWEKMKKQSAVKIPDIITVQHAWLQWYFPFISFLLYWQMVVIRQYGNTVVKIVFADFFFFFPRFGIYDLMIVLRALWSWTEGQSANVVWIKKLTCATWEWCSAETLSVWVQWCTHDVCTSVLHQSVDIWLKLKI